MANEVEHSRNYWEELTNRNLDWFFTEEPAQTTIYISRPGEFREFSAVNREKAAQLAILHLDTHL